MSKVNYTLPDGRVVSIDESEVQGATDAGTTRLESGAGEAEDRAAERSDRIYGGAEGAVASFGQGLGDTLTFGGLGKLESAVGGDSMDQFQRELAAAHPYARGTGELAALLSPTGWLGDTAKAASEFSGMGLASKAGEGVGGGALGRLAEGAVYGGGATVAETNVTGDPLSIEGVVEGAGIGALLNYGMGAAADRLLGAGTKAEGVLAEQAVTDAKVAGAKNLQRTLTLFDRNPESWQGFTDAVGSQLDAQADVYKTALKAQQKLEDFVSGSKFDSALNATEKTINAVSKYWREDATQAAAKAAERAIVATPGDVPLDFAPAELRPTTVDGAPADLTDAEPRTLNERTDVDPRTVNQRADTRVESATSVDTAAPDVTAVNDVAPQATGDAGRPPVSKDMFEKLKDYRARLRRIDQLRTGGFNPGASEATPFGRRDWVRDASVAADPRKAADELRQLNQDLRQNFPTATRRVKLPEIPSAPDMLPPEPPAFKMPNGLRQFARQSPETADKIAALVNSDASAGAAYQKLAADIGVDPAGGIKALHDQLSGWTKSVDDLVDLRAQTKAKEESDGFIGLARRTFKKAAKYSAARMVDVAMGGGWLGAAGRVVAGEGVGAGMSAIEDSAIGGAVLQGKSSIRQKVNDVVAKWSKPAAKVTRALGPVLTNLSVSLAGRPDHEKDPRKLAANRIGELAAVRQTAPDNLFIGLGGMMGHPSDVALKVHQQVLTTIDHLIAVAPKDPGIASKLGKSDWLPLLLEAQEFAARYEAAINPTKAIARVLAGDGTPAAVNTLQAAWPNVLAEAAGELLWHMPSLENADYARCKGYSDLLGSPQSTLQHPLVGLAVQSAFAPTNQQTPPSSPANSSGAPGRPPAVSNPVAGSSVSNLISQ